MKTKLPTPEHYIYPGEFVPFTNKETAIKGRTSKRPGSVLLPCAYTKELPGSYEVEVSMPCIQREQLVIYAVDNKLSVAAYSDKNSIYKGKNLHLKVVLPINADTELAIAEIKNSVLKLYIPKAKEESKHPNTRIVVY